MPKTNSKQVPAIAWGLSGLAFALAVIAWGDSHDWQLSQMGSYELFSLFGLIAFSLMWSHYVISAVRQHLGGDIRALKHYFEITSAIVLTAILLHPGLLLWQLWRDGSGLPPGSAKIYVGAAAYWAIILAIIAWIAFISYEFRRVFGKKRWWPLVQYASDGAMILIFVHALKLGGALRLGWYQGVWYFYGISFLAALLYGYNKKLQARKVADKK
jgi:hypothetical protein